MIRNNVVILKDGTLILCDKLEEVWRYYYTKDEEHKELKEYVAKDNVLIIREGVAIESSLAYIHPDEIAVMAKYVTAIYPPNKEAIFSKGGDKE